jgi:hypothetical protein
MVTDQLLEEIAAGEGEKLTTLARRVPSYRSGKPATLSRLLRWAMHGVRGPGGERIRLEAAKLPGGWISTPQALARFVHRQTPRVDGEPPPKPRTPAARRRANERAARELDRAGI